MGRATADLAATTGAANIACLCYILLRDMKKALDVLVKGNRLPEAAFFARTYCPSELSDVVKLWHADLATVNKAVSEALADPGTHPDLFPDFALTLAAETAFKTKALKMPPPASAYLEE